MVVKQLTELLQNVRKVSDVFLTASDVPDEDFWHTCASSMYA